MSAAPLKVLAAILLSFNGAIFCLAESPPFTARSLGVPVKGMTIWGRMLVRENNAPILYAGTYTGSGDARLIRFDPKTSAVEYYPLAGTKGGYGLARGTDGTIYVSTVTEGRFFAFDPTTKTLKNLGTPAPEETFIWTLDAGPDGKIYGATYPSAKVLCYDPATAQLSDLGRAHATEQYCRDLAVAANGKIYCGIGTRADVVAWNPATGEKKSVLPEKYKHNAFAYTVESEGNLVYVYLLYDNRTLIYDAETDELVFDLDPTQGGSINFIRQIEGGPIYLIGMPGGFHRFDPESRKVVPTDVPAVPLYDAETGLAFTIDTQHARATKGPGGPVVAEKFIGHDGEGMGIFSLGRGPDGAIYGGVYNLLHLFRYDPKKELLADLGEGTPAYSGEYYAFCVQDKYLYMASYTYAVLTRYDPTGPWKPGSETDSNPRTLGAVGEDQYRTPGLIAASDGKIYIGSIPTYGQLGGALSTYDPATNKFTVHRHIVPDQSVMCLAEGPGQILFGGTSPMGGGGVEPTAKEGHLFGWDLRAEKTVIDVVPKGGAQNVRSLVVQEDGLVVGAIDDALFVFDPDSSTFLHVAECPHGSVMKLKHGPGRKIYGITGSTVFRLPPVEREKPSPEFEVLCSEGGVDLEFDLEGNLYFGQESELKVIPPPLESKTEKP